MHVCVVLAFSHGLVGVSTPTPRLMMEYQLNEGSSFVLNPASAWLRGCYATHCLTFPLTACINFYFPGQSCWSDEDFVGRVARSSRRHVHPLNMSHATMTKLLIEYRYQWDVAVKPAETPGSSH